MVHGVDYDRDYKTSQPDAVNFPNWPLPELAFADSYRRLRVSIWPVGNANWKLGNR